MTTRTRRTREKPATDANFAVLAGSDAAKARALKAFRTAGNVSMACESAQIGRSTWYQWRDEDPAFRDASNAMREAVLDSLEEALVTRGRAESDTAAIFMLKSLRREQYGDRQKIEIVSTEVQDRLVRQAAVIERELSPEDAKRVLDCLGAEVWV